MYIPEFLCGVLATIMSEFIIIILFAFTKVRVTHHSIEEDSDNSHENDDFSESR